MEVTFEIIFLGVIAVAITYFVIERVSEKEKEDFEDRDN